MDRKARGLNNYLNGVAAEDCVERHYCEAGAKILKRRWRGKSGEVDLIFQLGTMFIFVEVKKAKDFAAAKRTLDALIADAKTYGDDYSASWGYSALAQAELKLGNRDAAIAALKAGAPLARSAKDEELEKLIQRNLSKLEKKQ